MKRLGLLALFLLVACPGQPRYVTYPPAVVDSLREMLNAAPGASLRHYDSAGRPWLLVVPSETTDGKALAPMQFTPLNHANECPPWC